MTPLTPAEFAAKLADGHDCYSAHATGGVTRCPPDNIKFPRGASLDRGVIEGWAEYWIERGCTFWPTEADAKAYLETMKAEP